MSDGVPRTPCDVDAGALVVVTRDAQDVETATATIQLATELLCRARIPFLLARDAGHGQRAAPGKVPTELTARARRWQRDSAWSAVSGMEAVRKRHGTCVSEDVASVRASAVVGLVAFCGCGSPSYGDAPAGSVTQLESGWWVRPEPPRVLVIAVDDAATDAARELRARVATDFLSYEPSRQSSCSPPYDPAAWHPVARYVVILKPSAGGDAELISFLDHPELEWASEQRTSADETSWSIAVGRAVTDAETPGATAYHPLATVQRWVTLIAGIRPAETDLERRLVAALPDDAQFEAYVASGRDDQSPGSPNDYTYFASFADPYAAMPTLVTPNADFSDCTTDARRVPRFAAWGAYVPGRPGCDPLGLFEDGLVAACASQCFARPVTVSAGGTASCRIRVTTDLAPCSSELGWLDPMDPDGRRQPMTTSIDGVERRVCDISQLEDAALDSCRNELECSACTPGWCVTAVDSLIEQCDGGGSSLGLRFVSGAGIGRAGRIQVLCNLGD